MRKETYFVRDLRIVATKAASTVLIAGIMFFFNPVSAQNSLSSFENRAQIEIVMQEEPKSIEVADGITLSPKTQMVDSETGTFLSMYRFLTDGTSRISFSKRIPNFSPKTGIFNFAYTHPDGAVLSMNKSIDTMDDNLVAFNIFKDKELLLSDVMEVGKLEEFICTVQERQEA